MRATALGTDTQYLMHIPESGEKGAPKRTPAIDAAAGGVAGCISRFAIAPLDVVKIRFQVQLEPIQSISRKSHYTGFLNAFSTILKEEGIQVRVLCVHGSTGVRVHLI